MTVHLNFGSVNEASAYKENEYSEYVKETTTPQGWKMLVQSQLQVFNEQKGKPAAGPKTTLDIAPNVTNIPQPVEPTKWDQCGHMIHFEHNTLWTHNLQPLLNTHLQTAITTIFCWQHNNRITEYN